MIHSYYFNSRSELISATLGTENFVYAFDEIGNRETATAYSANALNQYSAVGDFVPEYDADGNATLIKTATGTWSVSYNGENRPVRFENAGTQTVVEMNYDYLGRRFEKKITVAGTTTLHHRYIYRGFLQIACLDLTRAGTPALWFVFWDPTQPTGTRPLAIQKNGSWFVYGHDLTKNVCEVFGSDGYIKTTYSYSPFGNVSSIGNFEQNFQWSSEFYDPELGLVYYNYRHYSPTTARWLSRDPIEERCGLNLYMFCGNSGIIKFDSLGKIVVNEGRLIFINTETPFGKRYVGDVEYDWKGSFYCAYEQDSKTCCYRVKDIEIYINIFGRYSNEIVKKHEEYHLNLWMNTFYGFESAVSGLSFKNTTCASRYLNLLFHLYEIKGCILNLDFDINSHPKENAEEYIEEKNMFEAKYREQQLLLFNENKCLC